MMTSDEVGKPLYKVWYCKDIPVKYLDKIYNHTGYMGDTHYIFTLSISNNIILILLAFQDPLLLHNEFEIA